MASSIRRLARALHSDRTIIAKTQNPRRPCFSVAPPQIPIPLCNRYVEQNEGSDSSRCSETITRRLTIRTILAGFLGFGLVDVAYAESNEAAADTPPSTDSGEIPSPSDFPPIPPPAQPAKPPAADTPPSTEPGEIPPPSDSGKTPPTSPPTQPAKTSLPPASTLADLEEIAKKAKLRLEALLRSKGARHGYSPRFTVAVKGQKVTIKFKVPPSCEIPMLITSLVSRLGVTPGDYSVGSDMILRAWDSGVAWQLTLSRPKARKENIGGQVQAKDTNPEDGDLCILMFRPLISSDNAEIEFMKGGNFTSEELDALVSVMQMVGQPKSVAGRASGDGSRVPAAIDETIASLEGMGVKIYGLKQSIGLEQSNGESLNTVISWDNIAGYDHQKREIEDTILLALKCPEVYDDIARGTRCKFESNRPRAVLFEGPPGTGKTSCARVIANESGVPLLYVPLEVIMSKYYGESERMLGKVFSLADEIPNGAIVFLDEVDSVATARDGETHEATRRLLSVLLRQIDGFEQDKKVVVIAATNRKQDLDPALLSRFDCMIAFGLPDQQTREEIVAQYAKHLTKSELAELAMATEEMSGRDIRDVCQQAERHWASKVIRGQAEQEGQGLLPPVKEYIGCALSRRITMHGIESLRRNSPPKRNQFDFL